MRDIQKYLFELEMSKASAKNIQTQLQDTITTAISEGAHFDRSGKAQFKASMEEMFGITKQQAEIVRRAVQEIGNTNPEGIALMKAQLKETVQFVSGILEKMKQVNDTSDWMSQGKGFVDSFQRMDETLASVQETMTGLKTVVNGVRKQFNGFEKAFLQMNPSSLVKQVEMETTRAITKAEERLRRFNSSLLEYEPEDYSDMGTDELIKKQKELTDSIIQTEKALAGMRKNNKNYSSTAEDLALQLADLKAINNMLTGGHSGVNDVTTQVVATIKQAGDTLEKTVKNLKIDDIKLTVALPDANAAEFNAQVDDFVQQATAKFQGKPIEVSVDLINPFKDAKADTLPAEHEKKARELAEKFINAYNEAISQKDGADKKAKEAIDISGQLSALYDPSVSSVLMKFWDSWNKIYDSVKAGQTTLLEATKNWKQKMTEELKLKFVWFNEDAAEGVSDLFERINQMAEKNPIYVVPNKEFLIGEIEKVLSDHRFSLNVDLGDARIPISFTGGSDGNGGGSSGGTQPTTPVSQTPPQTPPTPSSVPDVSGELAETVDEMQDFAYTAESIGEVITRLSDNVQNISEKIQMLSKDIDKLDLDKVSEDEAVQKRKDQAKAELTIQKAAMETFEQQKKEYEEAYVAAQKEEEAAQAKFNAEKTRRDKASQALRAERDALFADNRTGQHSDKILALNEQIKELEAPFENGISALETVYNEAHKKLLTIERSIRAVGDNIISANNAIEELQGTKVLKAKRKELDDRNKELTAEKSKKAAFQSILDKDGNPVSLVTDRLVTFWENTDNTIESSRNKMEKLAPKLFAMENELKELQYELDDTDEDQDKDKHSALQERIDALRNKISEAEKAIDEKTLVKYRNHQKDANRASTRQDWMRAMGLGDIRDLGADEALEVITSVLQHYPALAASLSSTANGKVNLKGLNIVKQLIDFIPDVQSTLGVVATTNSESNEELLLKETFVNLFRIADQLNALDGLVDKKTGEVTVEALSGFITAFEKMPQMATVVQKAKALQKSTDELSDVLNNNDQLKEAFDIGEAKKYLTESFYDLWRALPDTVRGNFKHKTLNLDKMNSVDKADDFVRVVYDEFVRAFSVGKLNELKIDSPEWQSVMTLLKQGAVYANHEKATKGLKDSVMGADGIKRSLYELLHSADPIHVRVVGRDGAEHDYGVQDRSKAKMDVEHTYGQTPRSLHRAANKFRITDLLTEKFTIEKGIDAEILQLESELVALDQRISTLDKEADKRQIERLSTLRDTKQNKLNHLKELSATEDGRRQYEKESARRIRAIDEEIFGQVSLSTKRNAPKRKARRDYEYGDHTINKVEAERDKLKKEKERLEREISEIEKKDPRTDENGVIIASKAARARLQEVESLLAVDNAQKMAIESVRALDKDIETNTSKWKEADNSVQAYTRSLEALADAGRKNSVLGSVKNNIHDKMFSSVGQSPSTNINTLSVAKQYETMDKDLVEELEAKVAEYIQLREEFDAIPDSQRRKIDTNGKEKLTGRALELSIKIGELRKEIAKKYSEAEGAYLTNQLTEQLEQINSAYDRQEADVVAQSSVKSSDYQTQVDAANEAHQENVKRINATIDTQKSYYTNLIGKAQNEADKITEEWQEKVRQLNAAETKLPQYMIDEQTKDIKENISDLEKTELAPYKTRLQETVNVDERKELEKKIEEIQQKYARMLNEQMKPILDEANRIDREVQAKDKELQTYYYNQAQADNRILALREERKTATPQRTQEIANEINKIELEYTGKYQEELAKFKENLVRGFRQQMEEEARKVEEEGSKNAAQVLANAQKEAVTTYNNSESNTGKKVRVHTSIERELEAQRKAAIKAEGKAHREALAQITQVDPKQIKQETKAELAKIKAEREATKKATVDRFKENGAYKTDETLVTEHITASKEAAEKKSEELNKELEQRQKMRKTLMDEYHLSKEMVATQDKVAKTDAKRVKVKAKAAQSSAAESNTPPEPKSQAPSGGGQSGGGNYGGFINTSGLAQESTLRGIWELLNGGAPANGWGDEEFASGIKEELDLSVKSFSGKLNDFASGVVTVANSIRNLPNENMALFGIRGRIDEYLSGTENGIDSSLIKNFLNKHNDENLQLALHNHPDGIAALSPQDVQQVIHTKKLFGLGALGSVAGSKITGIDISDINDDVANEILNQFKANIRNSIFADMFDDDFNIKEEFANSPILDKQKVSDALNKCLTDAITYVKLDSNDVFGQIDVSKLDEASKKVVSTIVETGAQAAVEASSNLAKSTITQEEIDRYYADHTAKFRTVQKKNGKLGYTDDKFSSRVGQALLNSNVLNKDDSTFAQADVKRLQTAYDQIQQALAQEASKALGTDVITFLQKLQGEIAQKLQANGYGLEKVDTSPSALIKDTIINKDNIDKAKEYLGGLSGDEYKGSGSVETGLKWVNSVLNSTKQKLNQEDILKLGNGYERLMRAVQSGLVSKFDEDTQSLINEAIKISEQVLEQYDTKVIGSGDLLGKEITEANKALVENGDIGKIVTDMTNPAIMIGGKLKQQASASMQKPKKKAPAAPQSAEDDKVTKAQREQEELTRKTAENKKKQAKATQEVVEAEKKVVSAEREAFNKQKDAIASLFYTTGEDGKKTWSKDENAKALTFGLTNASKIFKDDLTDADVKNLHKTGLNLSNALNLDQIDGKVLTDEMKAFIRDLIAKIKAKLNVDAFIEAEVKKDEPKSKESHPTTTPTPKTESVTAPRYSAGGPQPTDGGSGGIPGLVRALVQLPNVVAKDATVNKILEALGNGIKSTGSGGKQPDDGGEKKSLNLSADEALARITAQVKTDYPGAVKTGDVRANKNSYSVDFWRKNVEAQKEAAEIEKEIRQMRADGIKDQEKYNTLIQQRQSLLERVEKITLNINKDTGDITSKVGIQNFAVGANAAEKELQTVQNVLSQLQDAGALQFKEDGSLTSQHESVRQWIQSMTDLQQKQDELISAGAQFDGKNQPILSQMTAETAKYRKEIMELLRVEGKFGGNVIDTFANPQALAGQEELYQKLLNIAIATGKVDMSTVKYDANSNTLSYTIEKSKNQVQDMALHMNSLSGAVTQQTGELRHVDTAWQKFGKSLGAKFQEVGRYLLSFGSIYRVWGMLKQGVGYIQEIDNALTELKKVTDQTDREYAQFLQTMSKTAGVVGSTTSELTKSAADWSRLGYTMQEAGELAKSTAILMNVSEFDDVNTATEALISSLQAFNYTADDSIKIVDKLNIVGNNFAISSDGIAEGLQRSASTLVAAGNSLEQSIAMLAAGNKVAQDPEALGNALKVLSMRIRGTKTDLEEAGEETDGLIENTSKLQAKVKALTNVNGNGGVDILTDTGAYRSTYDILLDIAEVWDEINDANPKNQAALLEILAGKTRGSQLAAILQNPEDLRDAYEMALDSDGSATKELETYLDSIQGKMQQFTNSVQTMWMNFIDSDTVKFIVDIGTGLIKTIEKVGLLNSALVVLTATLARKQLVDGLKNIFKPGTKNIQGFIGHIWSLITATNSLTKADVARALASKGVKKELVGRIIAEAGLKGVTSALTKEQIKQTAATLSQAFANKTLTASQYLSAMSTMGLKTALQGLWTVIKANPVMWISALVMAAANAFDYFHTTAVEAMEETKESFEEMRSVVESTKSTIQSLEDELATIAEQLDGFDGKELSFADQEEVDRLKKQRSELQKNLDVQNEMLKLQQENSNKKAIEAVKAYTKASSEGAEETRNNWQNWAKWGVAAVATVAAAVATGGASLAVQLGSMAAAGIAGYAVGNVAGEAIGSAVTENDGSYDSWYKTYTDAIDTARAEEQKALEAYQKDTSNIDKLDKWQEMQQKTIDIESEMYEHINNMQSYFANAEYGQSAEMDKALDEWNTFRDKFLIDQGSQDAEVNALDRLFGEDASEIVKVYRDKIKSDIKNGKAVDFQEMIDVTGLGDDLDAVGLKTQDVADYFTKLGEAGADASEKIDFSDVVSELAKIEGALDSVKSVMEEFRTEGIVSASTLEGMQEEFGGLGDAWENYAETMMSGTASMAEVQAATEALAKAYLDQNANDIAEDNMLTYIAQLEKFGVRNAKELVGSYINNDFFDATSIKSATTEFGELSDKIADAADAYDDIIEKDTTWSRGNVDYSNRPIVSAETMQAKYPEFDGDVATTYDMGMALLDSEGNIAYTVKVTPILEDGTVIDEKTLVEYVEGKLQDAYNNGGIQGVLDADKNGYNIVIATAIGEVEQEVGVLSEFDTALQGAKDSHLELVNTSAQGLIDLAAEKGIVLELADAYGILQAAEKVRTLEAMRNEQLLAQSKAEYKNEEIEKQKEADKQAAEKHKNVARNRTQMSQYNMSYRALEDAVYNNNKGLWNTEEERLAEIDRLWNLIHAYLINTNRSLYENFTLEDLFPEIYKDYDLEVVPGITVSQAEVNDAEKKFQELLDQMNLTVTPEVETAEAIDELARFESGMKSLSEAYQEYKKEGVVSFGTLSDLGDTFGNIQGVKDEYGELIKLMGTSGTSISTIETQMERLATAYLSTVDANKMILESEEARQVVISNLTNMGVRNAETIVNAKLQAMAQVQEAYGIDVENYTNASAAKLAAAISSAYGIEAANSGLVTDLANAYGTDLGNFTNAEGDKVAAAKEAAKKIAQAHRDAQIAELDAGFDDFDEETERRGINAEKEWLRKTQAQRDVINAQYNQAIASLDTIIFDPNDYIGSAFSAKDLDLDFNLGDDFWTGDGKDGSGSDNEFDWLDHYFTKIENKIKEKEAELENTLSADASSIELKNTLIDGIIAEYQKKEPLLENAIAEYNNRAAELYDGFSKDIQNKIDNGSTDLLDNNEYDEETIEKIQDYFDYISKASDLGIELDGVKVTIADFSLQKFDNASTAFDNEIEEKFQSDQDLLEAEIGYLEEQGKRVDPKLYEKLIGIQKEEQKVLEDKKATLENILATEVATGRVPVGSEQWYEMVNAINDVDEAIIQSKQDIESFKNSINEIYWNNFEKLIDQLDAVNSELSNLFDLLSEDDKVVDEFGNWTDEGIASLGLLAQQMENAQAKADEYAKAIKDLENSRDNYSLDEYNEKMAELKDNYLSEIKNIEDAKDAMVDLNKVRVEAVKEAIDKEIEALEEKNEKLKEELDLEKEQYDFQKQVAEQEKSMADIQRRLNALAGDNSASAIAERRKLQAELAEAQAEMDDMWYEHSIDEQQKSLDESLENYKENKEDEKEALDEWLEEEEKVIQESFDLFNSNVDVVASVLAAFEAEHGVKLTEAIVNPWNSGIDAMTAYRNELEKMKQEQDDAKENAEDAADDITESLNKPQSTPSTTAPNTTVPDKTPDNTPKSPSVGETVVVRKGATNWSRDGGNGTRMSSWVPGSSFTVSRKDGDEVLLSRNGTYIGWLKQNQLEGYYKGTTGVKDDQWAFTDELGPELTLHAGPNGQLQYLTKGSCVVTADLTKRLMEWGELDPTKVLEQSRVSVGAPHITTNNFDIDLSFGSLVHVDHCDQNTLPDLQKMVRGEFDNMMKTLNQKLKRK